MAHKLNGYIFACLFAGTFSVLGIVFAVVMIVGMANQDYYCRDLYIVDASWGPWKHNCTIVQVQENEISFVETAGPDQSGPVCTRTWTQTDIGTDWVAAHTYDCWSRHQIACDGQLSLVHGLSMPQTCDTMTHMVVSGIIGFVFCSVLVLALCYFLSKGPAPERQEDDDGVELMS